MKIKKLYSIYSKNFLIDTDTRNIRKNSIFFALKGSNFNGNKFAEEALKKGADYAVVDEKFFKDNDKIIIVKNSLKTLQNLASYHRDKLKTNIFALTGSNGKTTTKELLSSVLSQKHKVSATKGNLNNHIGVPLTLLSITNKKEIGIIEMGANNPYEIDFLCKIAKPNFGYITNFGKAHLEGFGSVEGVISSKTELYKHLLKNNGIAFVNPNDKIQLEKTAKLNKVMFNETTEFINANPFVKLKYNNLIIQSNLIGKYNFNNIVTAINIGRYFKINPDDIKKAIENFIPKNNRSQIIKTKNNQIFLDAYNANPTSMKAALENFNSVYAKNKTIVLGDMLELGASSLIEHQEIAGLVSSYNFQNKFFVGDNFYKTKTTNIVKFKTYEELKSHIKNLQIKEHHILIKGSRGMALERLVKEVE